MIPNIKKCGTDFIAGIPLEKISTSKRNQFPPNKVRNKKTNNNDNTGYYILDPGKMGDLNFSYYTGGLTFKNIDTMVSYSLRWSVPNPGWDTVSMEDFSLLTKNSKRTYTFQASDYYKMEVGIYSAKFRFCGTKHHTPDFNLNQKEGRIWVGSIISTVDNIVVE